MSYNGWKSLAGFGGASSGNKEGFAGRNSLSKDKPVTCMWIESWLICNNSITWQKHKKEKENC